MFTSYLRRDFSFCAVRAQSRLLLDRLELLDGEGVGDVARRRLAASAADRAADRVRQAQVTAMRQSRAVVRRGRIWED